MYPVVGYEFHAKESMMSVRVAVKLGNISRDLTWISVYFDIFIYAWQLGVNKSNFTMFMDA